MSQNGEFTTHDLCLAATLVTLDFNLNELRREEDGKRTLFVFGNNQSSDIEKDVMNDYWNSKVTVEPIKFFQSIRTIKNRLYNNT